MKKPEPPPPDGHKWIYRKSFRHHITGAIIRKPDGGSFRFAVPI